MLVVRGFGDTPAAGNVANHPHEDGAGPRRHSAPRPAPRTPAPGPTPPV